MPTLTRGGKLTLLNCAAWALVAVGVAADVPALMLPALLVAWPVAWLFILPTLGDRTPTAGITLTIACVAIGINSLAWGYGLSALISEVTALRARARHAAGDDPQRGFAVILPANAAPTPPDPPIARDPEP